MCASGRPHPGGCRRSHLPPTMSLAGGLAQPPARQLNCVSLSSSQRPCGGAGGGVGGGGGAGSAGGGMRAAGSALWGALGRPLARGATAWQGGSAGTQPTASRWGEACGCDWHAHTCTASGQLQRVCGARLQFHYGANAVAGEAHALAPYSTPAQTPASCAATPLPPPPLRLPCQAQPAGLPLLVAGAWPLVCWACRFRGEGGRHGRVRGAGRLSMEKGA